MPTSSEYIPVSVPSTTPAVPATNVTTSPSFGTVAYVSSGPLVGLEHETFNLSFRGYNIEHVDRLIADVVQRARTSSIEPSELRSHSFPSALKGYRVRRGECRFEQG
jgi:hypothetical protein